MDIPAVIALALMPSLTVLAAGICRATWVWLGETDGRRARRPFDRIRV